MMNANKNEVSSAETSVKVPPEYYCPITQEIMFDPVIASDGHIYEREAIETYMKTNQNSPLTREPLAPQLTPIHIIRSSIRQFLETHPTLWKEVYLSSTLIKQLIQAIQQGDVKQVTACLDKDKRLLEKPLQEITLLKRVCQQSNTQLLQTVIERLKRENLFLFHSELEACIKQEDLLSVKALLTLPMINLKTMNAQQETLLHSAVQMGNEAIVSLLLNQPIEIDAIDQKGNTALHIAVEKNYASISRLLIERGASIKIRNLSQKRPSEIARAAANDPLARQIEQWYQARKLKLLLEPLKEMVSQENKNLKEALYIEQQAREQQTQKLKEELNLAQQVQKRLENKLLQQEQEIKQWKEELSKEQHIRKRMEEMLGHKIEVTHEGFLLSARKVTEFKRKSFDILKPIKSLEGHNDGVTSLLLLPGEEVISSSEDKTLKVWDMKTGKCVKTLKEHSNSVTSLLLLASGEVVSGSHDKMLKVWDMKTGQCIKTLDGHSAKVYSLLLIPSGEVVSGSEDNTLKVWDIKTGQCIKTLKGHSDSVTSLLFLPSGEVMSGSSDKTLKVWDMKTGHCTKTLEGHSKRVTSLLLLPSGEVVSGSDDKTLKVWDMKIGQCVKTLEGHSKGVVSLLLLASGEVVSGSDDKTLKVWDMKKIVKEAREVMEFEEICPHCKTM